MALDSALSHFWTELLASGRETMAQAIRTAHYVARQHAPNVLAIAHFSNMCMVSFIESREWEGK
jgi:hypothetical protein